MADKPKIVRGLVASGMKLRSLNRYEQPNATSGENIVGVFEDGSRVTAWPGTKLYEQLKKLRAGAQLDFAFKAMTRHGYTSGATGLDQSYNQFEGVEIIFHPQDIHLEGYVPGSGTLEDLPEELKSADDLPFTTRRTRSVAVVEAAPATDPSITVSGGPADF